MPGTVNSGYHLAEPLSVFNDLGLSMRVRRDPDGPVWFAGQCPLDRSGCRTDEKKIPDEGLPQALLAGDFLEKFGRREGFRALFSEIDVRRLHQRHLLAAVEVPK